jgi:hypothetical protein
MTFHAFKEYLAYKWKAKSRHGIHSPFVYYFIENVLMSERHVEIPAPIKNCDLPGRYAALVARMAHCYNYGVINIAARESKIDQTRCDLLVFTPAAGNWNSQLNQALRSINKNGVIIIPEIHKTYAHTAEWNRIRATPETPVTIDLYGVGVLFFKEEFREKQHFILNY